MSSSSRRSGGSGPSFEARRTLTALGRLRSGGLAPPPDELRRRAQALLDERFGMAAERPAQTGFARGATGLLAEHTHYSEGFAVLLPLRQGTAVAVRPASGDVSHLALGERTYTSGENEGPAEARAAFAVLNALAPGPAEAAAVSAVPGACFDARVAALGAALAFAHTAEDTPDWEPVRAALAEGAGVPFSPAYVAAAGAPPEPEHAADDPSGFPPRWLLADTAQREQLPVAAPPTDELARGLLVAPPAREDASGDALIQPARFHQERQRQAERALHMLREHGFDRLGSFRDLEHRDLARAERLLPPDLQFVARHLVTQNRRVPRLIRAARTGDWQLFGALLRMSHLSHEDDWQTTDAPFDAVVAAAADSDRDGLYGACMTGRGPCVLVVGRPAALPAFLDEATHLLADRFDRPAQAMVL